MATKNLRFVVGNDDFFLDVDYSKASVVIHTPGGDITASWEEGEGFYGLRGLSSLDDDWDGDLDSILVAANKALEGDAS